MGSNSVEKDFDLHTNDLIFKSPRHFAVCVKTSFPLPNFGPKKKIQLHFSLFFPLPPPICHYLSSTINLLKKNDANTSTLHHHPAYLERMVEICKLIWSMLFHHSSQSFFSTLHGSPNS